MYSVCKVNKFNIFKMHAVEDILYKCGKNMAKKYDLHHWDNSHIKNCLILAFLAFKNQMYLVYDKDVPVATFQIKKNAEEDAIFFQKLGTSPEFSGGGIGSFCISEIEKMGKADGKKFVMCNVYDKSENSKNFYFNRGFKQYGTTGTLKYNELKLKKEI